MDLVLETIAKVSRRPLGDTTEHSALSEFGLSESLGLTLLRSALERSSGKKLPPLTWKLSVKDLRALLALPQATETAPSPVPVVTGPSVGIDIQELSALPDTTQFRSDETYLTLFSEAEIATAYLRPDPRLHLCGIFCVKEAVKKSHPALVNLKPLEIRVFHESGRPQVEILPSTLASVFQFQVSISHSQHYATAAVLALPATGH